VVSGEVIQFSAIHLIEKESVVRILYVEIITPEGNKNIVYQTLCKGKSDLHSGYARPVYYPFKGVFPDGRMFSQQVPFAITGH